MPSAVSGLTKLEAPSAGAVPSGSTRHISTGAARYCEYIEPPNAATVFPSRACAAGERPAATTTPQPSLPVGSDRPRRAAMLRGAPGGTCAVTTGRDALPVARSVFRSAPANSRP